MLNPHSNAWRLLGALVLVFFATTGCRTIPYEPIARAEPWPVKADTFQAGMAKVNLTPNLETTPVSLNGYGARGKKFATGVLDPVMARALVVSGTNGRMAAVVGVDLCYIPSELRERVVRKLADQGFDDTNVLISATHTHSSYAGYDRAVVAKIAMGEFDINLLNRTVNGIAGAIIKARDNLRPVTMEYATVEAPELNRSRFDPGFVHGFEAANTENKRVNPTDTRLTVVRFRSSDWQSIGALVHYAAHPTVLSPDNMLISADYPAELYKRIEAELGPDSTVVFLNGSLGDVAPAPDWGDAGTEYDQLRRYGKDFSARIIGALGQMKPSGDRTVASNSVRHDFTDVILRPMDRAHLPGWMLGAFTSQPSIAIVTTRIGDLTFLGSPGEATTMVGRQFESICPPERRCLTVAPSNAYMGYLTTPDEYEKDTYEADSTFYGPNAAGQVRDLMNQSLAGMR
ncbi:MAG: neutral/alkaline non-lysosomal ceramidase N-terminal domain-containing protein [Deltaproteobacteria bacterium]|nr:neutral/alkaline non-lysosomal ceramidase N-terminal domain-containing protein [bacterium]MCB9479559.1 neutral/alkaline non-lysosomal ceramidase N-terminal domain-containing protein [Deltaproteobacteria bacterium]MCB9488411.1 neutral/alkaline non-lysosomal ceramidase N-terminal domain-containing protein [Deltaproteobacteria bacterium]